MPTNCHWSDLPLKNAWTTCTDAVFEHDRLSLWPPRSTPMRWRFSQTEKRVDNRRSLTGELVCQECSVVENGKVQKSYSEISHSSTWMINGGCRFTKLLRTTGSAWSLCWNRHQDLMHDRAWIQLWIALTNQTQWRIVWDTLMSFMSQCVQSLQKQILDRTESTKQRLVFTIMMQWNLTTNRKNWLILVIAVITVTGAGIGIMLT